MAKLRLALDDLAVDTFLAGECATPWRGTVDAHAARTLVRDVCERTLLVSNPTCCPCTPMI
jgi:hypothetical protein